jgi:hypothetical protein
LSLGKAARDLAGSAVTRRLRALADTMALESKLDIATK